MIRLSFGVNTKIDLTLTEKTTVENPTYLFEFENNQTHQKVYCIAADTSVYPQRYNRFSIEVVTGTPVPLNGQIKLLNGDEYNYNVYAQSSTTNLDPDNADELVESGYMTYDKVLTQRVEYAGTNTTRKAYEK